MGRDRVRLVGPATPSGPMLSVHQTFFDTDRGEECVARSIDGGPLRCVPSVSVALHQSGGVYTERPLFSLGEPLSLDQFPVVHELVE